MTRKTLNTLAALAVGAVLGGAGTYAALADTTVVAAPVAPAPAVHCPVEDSCQADYRDGSWWVRTYDDHSTTPPGPWVRVTR